MNNDPNKPLKTLVVDDERLAREELTRMLKAFSEIEVIAEADGADSAAAAIDRCDPELIFLDIQMPGKTGFDLLNEIACTAAIIFVTAYDQHALRAFEVNAVDYLLKPISPDRLARSIRRVAQQTPRDRPSAKPLNYTDCLLTEFDEQLRFLKISGIVAIVAQGDFTLVKTNTGEEGLISRSMKEWEQRLPEDHFCRVHRSAIVNIDYVTQVEKFFNRSYRLHVRHLTEPLTVSRRYAKKMWDDFG